MSIVSLELANFKSFKKINIGLKDYNVLIGSNAAGKSNFIQIFKFIKDISQHGLDNAISMQGGLEYLKNVRLDSDIFSIKISFSDNNNPFILNKNFKDKIIGLKDISFTYEFQLNISASNKKYKITNDILDRNIEIWELEKQGKKLEKKSKLGMAKETFELSKGKLVYTFKCPDELKFVENEFSQFQDIFKKYKLPSKMLLLETPIINVFKPYNKIFEEISIYDFDSRIPKRAVPITGKTELEEDGGNLSIVLKNIMDHKETKRKFSNLIKDILPFVNSIDIQKFDDKSMLFKIKENYLNKYIPASLLSDGTINVVALIVALYFEKKSIIILEEPERNIHPALISKLMNMIQDASKNRQIIITTHNPEIVRFTDSDNLYLISRDEIGFSKLSKPIESEEVKEFLKAELGIEQLYVENMLEA
ncbi:MAG: AAA family ATPase [Methanothrix sp.]|nr:AAA family ATPase [Methanothrix sp.]